MPMNEAIVMTATSLCATCDISWASTPSSSASFSRPSIRPLVTQITAFLLLRPVANAFGMGDWAMATLGLGMSASAQIRSMMPCSRGACCGVTSTAPAVLSAILSDQKNDPKPSATASRTGKKMIAPFEARWLASSTKIRARMNATKTSAEQEHRQAHPRDESPVRRIAGLRHRAASVLSS